MSARDWREFDFGKERPGYGAIVDTIRAALEDEGLALGRPGASSRIASVIDRHGNLLVRVPNSLILGRPSAMDEATLFRAYRNMRKEAP